MNNIKTNGEEMNKTIWHESDDYKYDKFQAYWDFEHDHNKGNYKNACEQAFNESWILQQNKIDKLEQQLKEANEVIEFYSDNFVIDFKTYGGKKAKEYVNKYVIKEKK